MSTKYSRCAASATSSDATRRRLLAGGIGLLGAPLIAAAAFGNKELVTFEVAPGIHVRRGVDEQASAVNDNAIANSAFIVGRDSVAVIDPGGCLDDGRRLRQRIRALTSLPIRYVVMSHVHPDHIFGAGAFAADKPEFIGHARLPQALAQRGDYYRATLEKILGTGRSGPVIVPTRLVASEETVDLGDRALVLHAHGVAHSDCDLSVWDSTSGTLLLGDLLFVHRVPSLDTASKGGRKN